MKYMARVLVIGDTHAPAMREDYPDFLMDTYKAWNCDTVVHIGDVVDWGAINYHEKDPSNPSPIEEYRESQKQVSVLYRMFPKAVVMTGNHDSLPKRKATTIGIPAELIRSNGDIWNTPKWDWKPRYAVHEIDNVLYAHGDRGKGGHGAALKNAKEHFKSWVQGHLHGQASVTYFANNDSIIFGMSVGCGIDVDSAAMNYGKKFNQKPLVGCGVVVDGKYGVFEPMTL
jgi:predicted phosphodiesterase